MASPTRAETQARTRQLVLDAAERLFLAQGFAATSLSDIAREAGFSKGAVYSNFAGKHDLFFSIVEAQFEDLARQIRVAVRDTPDLLGRLAAVTAVYERYVQVETGWARWFPELASIAAQDEEARRRFAQLVQDMETTIGEAVADHQAAAGINAALAAADAAAIVVALVIGLTVRSLQDLDSSPALFQVALARLLLPDLDG